MKLAKRTTAILATVAVTVLLLLSGCAGSSTKEVASSGDSGASPAQDKAASQPSSIKVTAWGDPVVQKVFKSTVDQFNEKNKGQIAADLQIIPTDYDTKMTTMIAGNEAPDVAQMETATIAFPLANEGKFLDLRKFIETDPDLKIEDLAPLHGYYADNGELFGLNAERETFMTFYNVDMFKEAGLDMPPVSPKDAWDWDTFVKVAQQLTIDQNGNNAASPNFDPKKIKQYGVEFGKWWGLWGNFVLSNGGDFVSQDGKEFGLNKPEAADALQKLADLINVYHVAPSAIQEKSLPGGVDALKTKKVAMLLDGQWMNLQLGKAAVPYNVAPLPKMQKPVTMVVSGTFAIFKSTKDPNAAWKVLKSLVDPESAFELINTGNWLPSKRSWYTDPDKLKRWTDNPYHPSGFTGVNEAMLNDSVPTPTAYVKNFSKMMDLVNPALDKVWLGEAKAQDAMDSIEQKVLDAGIGRRDIIFK